MSSFFIKQAQYIKKEIDQLTYTLHEIKQYLKMRSIHLSIPVPVFAQAYIKMMYEIKMSHSCTAHVNRLLLIQKLALTFASNELSPTRGSTVISSSFTRLNGVFLLLLRSPNEFGVLFKELLTGFSELKLLFALEFTCFKMVIKLFCEIVLKIMF